MNCTTEERFWPKVEKSDGCWLWRANTNPHGYGQFYLAGKQRLAHRLSWEFANGPIANGLFVCHRCDNPACVRPDHLFLGTNADNMRDAYRKGRLTLPKGGGLGNRRRKSHCHCGHELTPDNRGPHGRGTICRICQRARIRKTTRSTQVL